MKSELLDEGIGYWKVSSPSFSRLPAAALEMTSPHLCIMASEALEMFREPLINIMNKEREYIITVEMPGVPKDAIEITLTGKLLEIEGTQRAKNETSPYTHRETVSKKFYRSLEIPDEVAAKEVKSKFSDGILEIVLTKKGTSKIEKMKVL